MSTNDFSRKGTGSDSWHTDEWVRNMFPTAFDPCPYNSEWDESHYDGLQDDWDTSSGVVFINPPYSNPLPWVKRALNELFEARMEGRTLTIAMLLKHDSSTRWYRDLHLGGAHFLMIHGRLSFGTGRQCAFPSVLVILSC